MAPLRPCQIHQHSHPIRTQIVTVWPAPGGRWHAGVNAHELHATTTPVTEEELARLLGEWGVEVDRWVRWLNPNLVTMKNPFLGMAAGEAWLRQ